MTSKCLEFCQTLVTKGQAFSFTIKVGHTFTFKLDTMEKTQAAKPRKKLSPSTKRRNQRRQTEFLAKVAPVVSETRSPVSEKQHVVSSTPVENEATDSVPTKDMAEDPQSFDCIQCDRSFKKKNALAVHVGKEHKTIEQLDGAYTSINEEMSFDHDKEEEEDEDESWKVVRSRRRSREKFRTWCQKIDVLWENRIAYMDIDEYEGDEK